MTCPKCHGDMRQYERSGVTVDQCSECRGIFLDRGELEKLFEAEANWSQQAAAPGRAAQTAHVPPAPGGGYVPPPPPPAPHQPGYSTPSHAPPPPVPHGYPQAPAPAYGQHQQHQGYHGHYRNKRRKGFLGEFFD